MSTTITETKGRAQLRLAQASTTAPGFGPGNSAPVTGPMFGALRDSPLKPGVKSGPYSLARYEAMEIGDGSEVRVLAVFIAGGDVLSGPVCEVVDLPAVEQAVTTVHHGSMPSIGASWEGLERWIRRNGGEPSGVCRELYLVLEPEPQKIG